MGSPTQVQPQAPDTLLYVAPTRKGWRLHDGWYAGKPIRSHRQAVLHLQGSKAHAQVLHYVDATLLVHVQPHNAGRRRGYLVTTRAHGRYMGSRTLPTPQEAIAHAERVIRDW